ncbi:MAG: OmpA family protein [Bacteroidales bacterium]|nr:OmpA family protein [Bacteroidales bacterium]
MATKDVDPRTTAQAGTTKGLTTESKAERTAETEVPPVTADVDETPKFIRYGAAVLLGLAFGVGCYVWFGDGVPSAPQYSGHTLNMPEAQSYAATRVTPDSKTQPEAFALIEADWTTMPQSQAATSSQASSTTSTAATVADTPDAVYLFSTDSSNVPENPELTAIATKVGKEGLRVDVRAYTDDHGRVAYNQRLSEKRAKAIGDYLAAHGVQASKITTTGMGPTHKYSDDAHDRRAEVRIIH